MKKVLAIFLLLQFLTNNSFAEQLIKMPRLFTHFIHHSTKHNDTKDFFDFLHKHYSDHHKNDAHKQKHNDEDGDCDLPFKHCDNCHVIAHAPVVGFPASYAFNLHNFYKAEKTTFIPANDRIQTIDIGNIWQPPKLS